MVSMLREMSPSCVTVRGTARTPRHQGSIERANGDFKSVSELIIVSKLDANPSCGANWANSIPEVMAELNSRRDRTGLSPYYHVFGIENDVHILNTAASLADLRACTNVHQLSTARGNTDFESNMRTIGEIDPVNAESRPPNNNTGENSRPLNNRLLPPLSSSSSLSSSSPSLSSAVNAGIMSNTIQENNLSSNLVMLQTYHLLIIGAANHVENYNECNMLTTDETFVSLSVGGRAHYLHMMDESSSDFFHFGDVLTFCNLIYENYRHDHRQRWDKMFVPSLPVANFTSVEQQVTLPSNVNYISSCLIENSHFVVVTLSITNKIVHILDGLTSDRSIWHRQICAVMVRYGLGAVATQSELPTTFLDRIGWNVEIGNSRRQSDGFSCGAIAMFNVEQFFNCSTAVNDSNVPLRKVMTQRLLELLMTFEKKLLFRDKATIAFTRDYC